MSAGFLFKLTSIEWALIIFAIIIVWMAEASNTAIEFLADSITKAQHPLIGKAKDVAAAGVLVTAIGAAIVGIIIFCPYLTEIVKR
ncbi:MAG: diacylglycerol kinase family protein [Victivallaceae bacterium]|nr:diacylglycerol kinase family protein [Victivallaceae bacterium]